jgi:hypothetical protein
MTVGTLKYVVQSSIFFASFTLLAAPLSLLFGVLSQQSENQPV